jgi:hypothetical protein
MGSCLDIAVAGQARDHPLDQSLPPAAAALVDQQPFAPFCRPSQFFESVGKHSVSLLCRELAPQCGVARRMSSAVVAPMAAANLRRSLVQF